MTIRLVKCSHAIKEQDLESVEESMGVQFPEDYRNFLLAHNGCRPESNVFDVGTDNDSGIREFYSIEQVMHEKEALNDRLPESSWPIGEDDCGNLVNLHYEHGKWMTVFWDHELEQEVLLAESFHDFLNMLRPFDLSSVQLKPSDVHSVWLHPDLDPTRKEDDKSGG